MSDRIFPSMDDQLRAEVVNDSLHETPHFKPNGGCDCICDDCIKLIGPPSDYVCICKECSGQCGSSHEVA